VRRLRQLGAYPLAQSYVRMLDDSGISPQLKADLLNEAGRQPPGQELQQAVARLQQAVQEGDAERTRYWAEQVLALQPGQPDAAAALYRLREQRDEQVLTQAREAYRLGQHRVAISLLSNQIQDDSRFYPEALELIRQAEARRSVETALTQAREKLNLGDTVAAEALVREALRKEPEHPAARALMDEIDTRSGATARRLAAAGIGLLLAALIVGFVVVRYRRRLEPLARKLRLDDEPAPGFPPRPPRPEPRRPEPAAEPRQPPPEREPPRAGAADTARRRVVEALAQEIDRMLHDLRAADVLGRLKATLMEMEAELSAMQRRVADPTAELGPLHNRLRALLAQARKLTLRPRREADGRSAPGSGTPRPHDEPQEPPRHEQGRSEHGWQEQGRQEQGRQEHSRAEEPRQEQTQAAPPPPGAAPGSAATHYEVLQVPPDATPEQIKAAYHQLIKQYHPDLHNASQFDWVRAESERMSRRISEAFRVLGSAGSRSRYDRALREKRPPGPGGAR
jgi:tetratricopeptide (TPR) repeat protein